MISTLVWAAVLLRQILVGKHDDAGGAKRLDDFFGVARSAADVGFGFYRSRCIDIADDRHPRMALAHQPDVGCGDRRGERAAGLEIGDQHGFFRVQQFGRLGHEMDPGQHDHIGVGARGLAKVHTRTHELDGLRHLDAEDATLRHVLAWALEHDPGTAVRLALTIAPWWSVRGRLISRASLLTTVAELADAGSDEWCVAHMFLGQVAAQSEDPPAALDHFTAARDALQDAAHSDDAAGPWLLSLCLGGRASALIRVDRVAEAIEDGRRALELARQTGIGGLEATALTCLSLAVWHDGDREGALRLARQALQISEEFAGALERGLSQIVTGILTKAGDLAAAEQACSAALASCRDVGDLTNLCGVLWHRTILDLRTGRIDDAPAHLRELLQIATQTGLRALLPAGLDRCGHLCAATGRPAEALTMWAAMPVLGRPWPMHGGLNPDRREQLRRQAREVLGPARARAAEERGAAMSLATATEFALLVAAEPEPPRADGAAGPEPTADGTGPGSAVDGAAGLARLSPRERQLVTLVAQGRTDAQIAAQLYITVRTVGSHLDRVRDKTGCRRRADLTRLALSAGLTAPVIRHRAPGS